ncbi:hypothetical protein DAH66_22105 [Sphingomonas koreensis]|uniref:Uncharacterized protein n=2 Tax=Sphingomonas koreensis TaxID=93064 RepID=A0A2M8WAH8_9SPHN|nr:uncharacterized membrane protein HdeD (DUF308 family) [Sphingomonas koreensis]RSU55919.1 hypothetical protein DAH56_19635 [Sphingomonas koreensis]RSU66093.1 hypothetical protein DAH55_15875 [Sphingomonas koreensis]RSY76279.1 hypothetical protein DAH66_22105 [Sphingomonas koreensis]
MPVVSTMLRFAGGVSLLCGVLAILNPLATTMAAVTLAALALVLSGAIQFVSGFSEPDWHARAPSLLVAAAALALGLSILFHPVAGARALTILMGLLLLLSGLAKLGWSVAHRMDSSFWPLLISGLISLLLALLVYRHIASGRSAIIGIFLGVELMLNGLALLAVAALGRRFLSGARE